MDSFITCGHCHKQIPYDMVNAVLSDSCPFCGFNFATSGVPGLKECYADIIDMLPSIGSLDFKAIHSIVKFVFGPDFEKNRETLAKHLSVLGLIFGMEVVDAEDVSAHVPEPVEVRPVPAATKPVSKNARKPSSGGSTTRVRRRESASEDDSSAPRPPVVAGGFRLSDEAMAEVPDEFKERARNLKSDEDYRALIFDIVSKESGE